jgi:hypothetical protein
MWHYLMKFGCHGNLVPGICTPLVYSTVLSIAQVNMQGSDHVWHLRSGVE